MKKLIKRSISKIFSLIPSDWLFLHLRYLYHHRRIGDFKSPKSLTEYLQYKKIFDRSPLLALSTDKITVRDFVRKRIGKDIFAKLFQVCCNPKEIEWDKLPMSFVLKTNHGSSMNILVEDKYKCDTAKISAIMTRWLSKDFYWPLRQWAYKDIRRRLLVEEYLRGSDGNVPDDYKFFCFHGEPLFVQVDHGRFSYHRRSFFDLDWKELNITFAYEKLQRLPEKPKNLHLMVEYASIIAREFIFCRVDFYDLSNRVVFGEVTHYPEAGFAKFDPVEFDFFLGEVLNRTSLARIPHKYYVNSLN